MMSALIIVEGFQNCGKMSGRPYELWQVQYRSVIDHKIISLPRKFAGQQALVYTWWQRARAPVYGTD